MSSASLISFLLPQAQAIGLWININVPYPIILLLPAKNIILAAEAAQPSIIVVIYLSESLSKL
jgi:hypothetical protein